MSDRYIILKGEEAKRDRKNYRMRVTTKCQPIYLEIVEIYKPHFRGDLQNEYDRR